MCNGKCPPDSSFEDDVATVQNVVKVLVEAGERVLMVMHSYGGAVGTDAVEGLTFAERKTVGKSGGVVHLFYMCAYILQPGASVFSIVEEVGYAPLWPQFVENFPDGSTFPVDPVQGFFGGVEKDVVHKAMPHLVKFPMKALEAKTKGSVWKIVPVTYILTQQDYSVPRVYQDLMLGKVRQEGVLVKTDDFDTAHSIFITKQDEMVQAVVGAAADERNPK